MKNIKIITLLLFCFVITSLSAQNNSEILLKLDGMQKQVDMRFDLMQKQTDIRFDGMQKQFDAMQKQLDVRFEAADKKNDMLFYVMITILVGIFGLIGFVVWDRQASLKPIEKGNKELADELLKVKEISKKYEGIFKRMGEVEPRFAEIFRNAGIL